MYSGRVNTKLPHPCMINLRLLSLPRKKTGSVNERRKTVIKYQWGDKQFETVATVAPKYIRAYQKGCEKAKQEFPGCIANVN